MKYTFTNNTWANNFMKNVKFLLIATVFTTLLQFEAKGQTVYTITPGGTLADRDYFPLKDGFNTVCARSASITDASWMSTAGMSAGNISAIGWLPANTPAANYNGTISIYMQHTTENPISTTWDVSGATLVYSGSINVLFQMDVWHTFNFTTPFAWNGTNNVKVFVEFQGTMPSYIIWRGVDPGSVVRTAYGTPAASCPSMGTTFGDRWAYTQFTQGGASPLAVGTITATQQTGTVTKGSTKQGILKIDIPTSGSTGTQTLNSVTVTTANTNNADIAAGGVKLWVGSTLATAVQLGSGQNAAASVTFSGLSQSISGATTSLWVTYDIASGATLGNFVDAQIASGGITITASGGATAPGTQPASTLNPAGNRKIDYCNDLYSNGCNNVGIGDVSIGTAGAILNQTGTGCTGGLTFADYTALSGISMSAGSTYPVNITDVEDLFPVYSAGIGIWIDLNQNGSFGDVGELIGSIANQQGPWAFNITVPAGASSGTYRMRIKATENVSQSLGSSCSKDNGGETHDYLVTISGGASCTAPNGTVSFGAFSGVSSSATTTNVTYTNGGNAATGYVLLRNTTNSAPTAPASGTAVPSAGSTSFVSGYTVVGTSTTLGSSQAFNSTGLSPSTTYYYWVMAYQNTNGPCWFTPVTQSSNSQATTAACVAPSTPATPTGQQTGVCSGSQYTYTVTAVAGATSYDWILPSGWTAASTNTATNSITATAGSSGYIRVRANNCGGSSAYSNSPGLGISVTTPASISFPNGSTICPGEPLQIIGSGGSGFSVSGSLGLSSSGGNDFLSVSNLSTWNFTTNTVQRSGTCPSPVYTITLGNIPSAPTGNSNQTVSGCNAPTLASLNVTGTSIKWYNSSSGGTLLNSSTVLVNGTTYYASQTNGCESVNRLAVTVTLSPCTITWTAGAVNVADKTIWSISSNWSTNTVPTSNDNVVIPTSPSGGNYYPVVNGIQTASVRDMSIAASATITFSGAATLEVNGDFTNNGTANFETGELQMKGTNKTLNGNFTLGVLNIQGNTAIDAGGQVNVLDKLELQSGELNTNNKLTLKSSAAKTAFVDDFSSGFNGTVTGNLTIERYVPGSGNKFHYFGALTGNDASKWNDDYTITSNAADNTPVTLDPLKPCGPTALAVGSAYGNLLTYDETLVTNCFLKGWRVRNTSATTDRGRGFAGRVPSTTVLTETGTYAKDDVTLSGLTVTGANTDATSKGFHFVSNPFWAPILWSGVTGSNLYGTAYRYDPNTGSYGAYNNITVPMEISTNEAFFVRGNWATVNDGNSTFSITFPASARTTGENNTFLRSGLPYAYGVKITVNAHNTTDHTLIAFDNRFSTAHDNGYDALKLDNDFNVANIYTLDATAQRSAILALPENTATASVPLNIDIRYTDVHELTFDLQSFPATAMVFLEDKTTGVWHNLRINNSYSFNATAGDNSARFVLHFTPAAVFNATASGCENNTGIISIQQDGGITWDYEIKDEQNTTVYSGSNLTGYMEFVQLAAGNYTIALVHESGYTATENITVIATENISLTVNATANTIFVNEPVTVNAILSSNGTTNWDMGDGTVYNNTETVTHSYTGAGNYTVSATAANDNCDDTKTIDITVEENLVTGIAANNDKTLKVYASGNTVFVEQYVSKELVNADLTVYNTLGQIIQQEKISELNYGAKQQINVNASSGIYYLHVVLSNGKEVQTKFLINR